MMQLNGLEISDDYIERFLDLSRLPGSEPNGIKQAYLVSRSAASQKLPEWMFSTGIDYFDRSSLLNENENLAIRMQSVSPWMTGNKVSGIYPGEVNLNNVVIIAYNILDDLSAAIFIDGDSWRLIFMDRAYGKLCWRVAYDRFEDFLIDLGV